METNLLSLMQWAARNEIDLAEWIYTVRQELIAETSQKILDTMPAGAFGNVQKLSPGVIASHIPPLVRSKEA